MSCQQASRFTTTTQAAATAQAATAATRRIATAAAAAPTIGATNTTTQTAAAKLATTTTATKTTPVTSLDVVDVEGVVVVAAGKTNTPEDPYVFTETIAATPPILFNAQKSRARLSEAQHSRNCNNNNSSNNNNNNNCSNNNNFSNNSSNTNNKTVANKKSSIVAATSATASPFAATATTVATARAATAKAQASLGAARTAAATPAGAVAATVATNYNNVSQSQPRQPSTQQQQLQLQSQQTSAKRATNVCVVRPQQQQLQQQQQQHQQQLKQQQQLAKLSKPPATHHATPPPPPLYTHTPSLWQTPLILDTSQKQHQQQQQQQQHVAATALVSPPTSPPASLSSPPTPASSGATPTAAVTAMVSPIVTAATATVAGADALSASKGSGGLGGSLPPSKFHHTTLAQHLQKVECLKKKKSLPLVNNNSSNNNNNNNVAVESVPKRAVIAGYNLTQPPPLMAFNTSTPETVAAAVETKKHSVVIDAAAVDNSSDLNEIPVNVIFRKPPVLPTAVAAGAARAADAKLKLGAVTPLTPPTTPSPSALKEVGDVMAPTGTAAPPPPPVPATLQNEQTSSKVAKRRAPAAAGRKGNKNNNNNKSINNNNCGSVNISNNCSNINSFSSNTSCSNTIVNSSSNISHNSNGSGQSNNFNNTINSSNINCSNNISSNNISVNSNNTNVAQDVMKELPALCAAPAPASTPVASSSRTARRRKANAICKRSVAGGNALLISENDPLLDDVPYCLQTRWLNSSGDKDMDVDRDREERIAVRKGLLRRQALQLLSTRPLQELPMRAARQRLQCVQSLLLKYQDHASQQQGIGIGNRCLVSGCKEPTLSMAAHCERHIVHNTTQQLFQPCVAWRVNGSACQTPVFDVLHTLALCPAHSHLRRGLEQQKEKVVVPPPQAAVCKPVPTPAAAAAAAPVVAVVAAKRKRKTNPNANPVGRPLKRAKKLLETPVPAPTLTQLPPMSAVLQRKSSTTSLESIASNSQSSAMSHSQAPPVMMPQLQSIVPPALAPLSDYHHNHRHHQQQPEQLHQQLLPAQQQQHLDSNVNMLANANFKADEISQIVAQLAASTTELQHNNNLHYNHNSNNNNNNMSYCSNNNSNSGSSSISCGFPSFNAAFGQVHQGQGQLQGQLQGQPQLASTESLLSQHMFGICENSSAYASSEDTGLGGLSESELIGANDADDIALNGAHLLEEHDLENVFDTLPDDAFNELFQSVQQADCEAVDRALELADKNLKCLQQTIGSTAHDSAFLNDFLDVGDDLLVDAVSSVMNSPNTSGIDASTLFVDSSASGNSSSNSNSANGTSLDIRGLVLT